VPSEDIANAFEDKVEPTNPPKSSWIKFNHPSRQLIGNLDEGRLLGNRVIQPSDELANEAHITIILHSLNQRRLMKLYKMKVGSL